MTCFQNPYQENRRESIQILGFKLCVSEATCLHKEHTSTDKTLGQQNLLPSFFLGELFMDIEMISTTCFSKHGDANKEKGELSVDKFYYFQLSIVENMEMQIKIVYKPITCS